MGKACDPAYDHHGEDEEGTRAKPYQQGFFGMLLHEAKLDSALRLSKPREENNLFSLG